LITTSVILAQGFGVEHRSILELVRKYSHRKIFQTSTFEPFKLKTKGRLAEVYNLDENQAMFIGTLMRNSDKVLDFKEALIVEFSRQRIFLQKLLTQKSNAEWIEKRQDTKVMRRECTDKIQEFIAYAKEQGSKSADHYYSNFTRMELSGLFLLEGKYPNARDVMSMRQLNLIEMADEVISQSLKESMEKKLPYKECYHEAKARIEQLARILPKSPLPSLLGKD